MGEQQIKLPGLVAGESMTTKQYYAVQHSTAADRTVLLITNANAQRPIGILQNDPGSGEPAEVVVLGMAKAIYGGSITRGDKLACGNDGSLISDAEVADGSAVDLHHIAIALESGSSGDIRWVLVIAPQFIGKE